MISSESIARAVTRSVTRFVRGAPVLLMAVCLIACTTAPDNRGPGTLKWRFIAGDAVLTSPAVDTDGVIYFTTAGRNAWAVNPDGSLKWQHTCDNVIWSSPVLGDDGRVYFGMRSSGAIKGLTRATGSAAFSYHLPMDFPISEPAIGPTGTLFYATSRVWDEGVGRGGLYALEPVRMLIWFRGMPDYNPRYAPVVTADGTIIVLFGYGVRAFNPADGSQLWEYPAGVTVTGNSPAIGIDGTVYFGTDGALLAISEAGGLIWSFARDGREFLSPIIGADGTIYAGTRGSSEEETEAVYAVTPAGTLEWSAPARNCLSAPAIDNNGRIYLATEGGYLLALNHSGKKVWAYEEGSDSWSAGSPVIGPDGTLYLGTARGRLVAIRTGSGGPDVTAPWYRFRGSNTNSGRVPW